MTRTEFNGIVVKLSRKLYGFAFRILHDEQGSEDAVQEVLLKIWKMDDSIGKYGSIEALATTMTKNYCIDQLRKSKRNERGDLDDYGNYKSEEPTPQERLERDETLSTVNDIISNLPDNYRKLVQLRDIDGISYEEMAELTSQSINNLRVGLSRARTIIRDEYKKRTHESGRN